MQSLSRHSSFIRGPFFKGKQMEELKNRVYITAKSRFIASLRLERRQRSLVYLITFMTLAQIAASVVLLKIGTSPHYALTTCLAITFSVFIAIISNSDSMSKDVLHAHLLHKCGVELMSLYNRMCASDSSNISNFVEIYDKIISDCNVNHDPIDFRKLECQIQNKNWFKALPCSASSFFKTYGLVILYLVFSVIVWGMSYLLINSSQLLN